MNDATMKQTIERIAREELEVTTLEARNSDQDDFHTLAVWEIETVMERAFEAGIRAAAVDREGGNDEQALFDAVREQLSPQAVAAIAAFLQAATTNHSNVNRQIAWFRDRLVEAVGQDQHDRLCDEMGL